MYIGETSCKGKMVGAITGFTANGLFEGLVFRVLSDGKTDEVINCEGLLDFVREIDKEGESVCPTFEYIISYKSLAHPPPHISGPTFIHLIEHLQYCSIPVHMAPHS